MEILVRGENVSVTESIKDYISDKLKRIEKYIDNNDKVKATVSIKVRNHSQKVEVTIPLKKFILRTEEEQDDVYAAIDVAIDKLERQIRKNKTKLQTKKFKESKEVIFNFDEDIDDEEESGNIVKRKKIEVKPMSEEEAIIQMELLGHAFYMFKDSSSLKPTLIYKRTDGNYGVIETE